MKNTKICKSCEFWDQGDCKNPKVYHRVKTYDYAISFSKDFGCVFWAANKAEFYANGCSKKEEGMDPYESEVFLNQIKPQKKLPKRKGKPLRIIKIDENHGKKNKGN